MRTEPSVENLLFGQTRGKTLALLFGAPGERFYVRQIARQTGTSVGTIQRELALLTRAGLIERSKLGMQVFYRANPEFPAFAELRALLDRTVGLPIRGEEGQTAEPESVLPAELL